MPIYEYECSKHGRFEMLQSMMAEHKSNCPECGEMAQRIFSQSIGIRIINPVRRQFGSNAPSQLIPSKVPGGLPSYVISEGALEQEEIDHIGLVEEEREVARQKQGKSDSAKAIGNLVTTAKQEKQGKRFSTMKKIQAEGM